MASLGCSGWRVNAPFVGFRPKAGRKNRARSACEPAARKNDERVNGVLLKLPRFVILFPGWELLAKETVVTRLIGADAAIACRATGSVEDYFAA